MKEREGEGGKKVRKRDRNREGGRDGSGALRHGTSNVQYTFG